MNGKKRRCNNDTLADAAIITNMTFMSALFTWTERIVVEDGIWFRSRLLPRAPEKSVHSLSQGRFVWVSKNIFD
jgi:hypothetical protein